MATPAAITSAVHGNPTENHGHPHGTLKFTAPRLGLGLGLGLGLRSRVPWYAVKVRNGSGGMLWKIPWKVLPEVVPRHIVKKDNNDVHPPIMLCVRLRVHNRYIPGTSYQGVYLGSFGRCVGTKSDLSPSRVPQAEHRTHSFRALLPAVFFFVRSKRPTFPSFCTPVYTCIQAHAHGIFCVLLYGHMFVLRHYQPCCTEQPNTRAGRLILRVWVGQTRTDKDLAWQAGCC